MLTTHYFQRADVLGVMSRQIFFYYYSRPVAAAVAKLKGSELSFETAARPSYFKGCTQEHTNNAFIFMKLMESIINKISQSIEPDCERLQCLMSIYNRQNGPALADYFFLLGYRCCAPPLCRAGLQDRTLHNPVSKK